MTTEKKLAANLMSLLILSRRPINPVNAAKKTIPSSTLQNIDIQHNDYQDANAYTTQDFGGFHVEHL